MIDFNKGVYDPENRDAWFADSPPVFHCPSSGLSRRLSGTRVRWGEPLPPPIDLASLSYMACHGSTETPIGENNDGVFFLNSKLRSRDIPDGTSNTIFFGESVVSTTREIVLPTQPSIRQYILPEDVEGPFVYGNLGWMSGTPGTIRNTSNPPNVYVGPFSNWAMPGEILTQLKSEASDPDMIPVFPPEIWAEELSGQFIVGGFGSNHVMVTNFALGDASVRSISTNIDLKVYRKLGSRRSSEIVVNHK
jgi:hypothetical protein